ncbi:MAG: ribonuclease III [Rhizobiaceae bacterium]
MSRKRPAGELLAAELATRTGHSFADIALAQTALTHSSAPGAKLNNERLEFLGDRVLGLVLTEMLYSAFPDAPQGELAVRLSLLASGETCAAVALELGLDGLVRTDAGLRGHKGQKTRNVLADAVEALIAAIYIDGGMPAARRFVLGCWEDRARALSRTPRDAKTELQEWAVRQDGARPVYAIEKRDGPDHDPVFTVVVNVPGFAEARATGRSKQAAERAAATVFLTREDVWAGEAEE